ncbi:MAG TPA: hypothetical protein VHL34_06770 [Rhizomicrobium sp.]|jgi:hypothetical protein|nr:hypothetical protein [Rhizomicrobium sp.]
MTFTKFLAGAAFTAALATGSALADTAPMDQIVDGNGIQTACTGVGSAKDHPEFQSWPAQIEFANAGTQYLSGVHVVITKDGQVLRDTVCNGPWLVVKGPGTMQVKGSFEGMVDKSETFTAEGPHKRITLMFAKAPNQ